MKKASAAAQIQATLDATLSSVSGVTALLVSDAEGVVLLRSLGAYQENSIDVALAAVFAASTVQASKLQFGKSKAIATFQKHRTVVFVNAAPLFVTIVAGKDCNVGALIQMAPQLIKTLEPLRAIELEGGGD